MCYPLISILFLQIQMFSRVILILSVALIDDFRRFSQIFADFIIFAHRFERFQEANRFKWRSFHGFRMDPSNFRMKIHEISALTTKRYLDVTKTVPDVKITLFCKVLPGRAQKLIFRRFL